MAHLVLHGNHELLATDFVIKPGSEQIPVSRRQLVFDKHKLKDPAVAEAVRNELASIPLPGRHIEQTSRSFIVLSVVQTLLCTHAPKDRKTPKNHWITEGTLLLIEFKDNL